MDADSVKWLFSKLILSKLINCRKNSISFRKLDVECLSYNPIVVILYRRKNIGEYTGNLIPRLLCRALYRIKLPSNKATPLALFVPCLRSCNRKQANEYATNTATAAQIKTWWF